MTERRVLFDFQRALVDGAQKWSEAHARDAERSLAFMPLAYAPRPVEDARLTQSREAGADWDRRMTKRQHADSCAPNPCHCPLCDGRTGQ